MSGTMDSHSQSSYLSQQHSDIGEIFHHIFPGARMPPHEGVLLCTCRKSSAIICYNFLLFLLKKCKPSTAEGKKLKLKSRRFEFKDKPKQFSWNLARI